MRTLLIIIDILLFVSLVVLSATNLKRPNISIFEQKKRQKTDKDILAIKNYKLYNAIKNTTKLFIVLPVREREFVGRKQDLFVPINLDTTDFPFKSNKLIAYETLYTGYIYDFLDFPRYLSSFKLNKTIPNQYNTRYSTIETYRLFKDYTVTKAKQCENFSAVQAFINPADSVDSIYRLLQRKYVTVVSVEYNGKI